MRDSTRRIVGLVAAPLLALLALGAWALASPVGASPDDDYHLTSVWCADVIAPIECGPGPDATRRTAPEGVVDAAHCYRWDSAVSAACQGNPGSDTADVITKRGNFRGGYPPVHYAVLSLFVGPDVTVSALVMRAVNVVIAIGLFAATYLLLPARRRPALVGSWIISSVPLGLFLFASNNPSAWAIAGIGVLWIATLGYYETTGRRRIGLGIVAGLATLVAAGARGDAAMYAVLALGVGAFLALERTRRFALLSLLPLALAVLSVLFFVNSRQVISGIDGFTGVGRSVEDVASIDPLALWVSNLLNLPRLWGGFFGAGFGLGWLDTPMPGIVAFAGILAFLGVGFAALRHLFPRKAVVVAGLVLVLSLLPLWVLGRGLYPVGEQVQPRYLLPLLFVLGGVLLLRRDGGSLALTRVQTWLVVGGLSVANAAALHATMRRFITGTDNGGLNLNTNVEWWWDAGPSPMVVLAIGSIAFAALLAVLVRTRSSDVDVADQPAPITR
jgi:hypothetical protein